MTQLLRRMWRDDEGQDLVEYALLAALVSIASIAALGLLSAQINAVWAAITAALNPAP